ncbi:phage holin family protein [Paraoerskovia marina]|uniref:Putative Holin-X, holin superfamily III n=1 Tax=Paraoerskovia marina TaxID=545619 RepID=A0A1H1W5S3_9CELL|nr:phage holin family protein [Paraoerskovia marina]SDS91816.1 Putative Holin-X, holin superfamily III [Paraoerskovia marina]
MSDWDDGTEPPKPTIGKLVEQLTEQTTRLIKAEIALAKHELTTKATNAGIGIALFVVAGVLALYALGWLLFSAYAGLAVAMPEWLAALVLGVVLLLIIAVLALVGKTRLQKGLPPKPEAAMASVQEDIAAVKGGDAKTARPTDEADTEDGLTATARTEKKVDDK